MHLCLTQIHIKENINEDVFENIITKFPDYLYTFWISLRRDCKRTGKIFVIQKCLYFCDEILFIDSSR